jgi:hypothetical protein
LSGPNSASALATVEVFDPKSNSWDAAAPMLQARAYPAAATLADGSVLVAGGSRGGVPLDSAERYFPDSGTWVSVGSMSAPRTQAKATVLKDGRVLVTGGGSDGIAELPVDECRRDLRPGDRVVDVDGSDVDRAGLPHGHASVRRRGARHRRREHLSREQRRGRGHGGDLRPENGDVARGGPDVRSSIPPHGDATPRRPRSGRRRVGVHDQQ